MSNELRAFIFGMGAGAWLMNMVTSDQQLARALSSIGFVLTCWIAYRTGGTR